jgi:xanthine dehydrogenase molybdopterin-binding subunit B
MCRTISASTCTAAASLPSTDVIFGSKGVGEPPLMLAISVREALRDAVAAFGSARRVDLGAPATPEAILAAIGRVHAERVIAIPVDDGMVEGLR